MDIWVCVHNHLFAKQAQQGLVQELTEGLQLQMTRAAALSDGIK